MPKIRLSDEGINRYSIAETSPSDCFRSKLQYIFIVLVLRHDSFPLNGINWTFQLKAIKKWDKLKSWNCIFQLLYNLSDFWWWLLAEKLNKYHLWKTHGIFLVKNVRMYLFWDMKMLNNQLVKVWYTMNSRAKILAEPVPIIS